MAEKTWTINKNLYDLEYQKTLTEYNNWLSARVILALTSLGVAYEVFHITNIGHLLILGSAAFVCTEIGKREALRKLNLLSVRIRALAPQ